MPTNLTAVIDVLMSIFSIIPHFSFQFKHITNVFDLDWRSEYAQSLALISAVVGAFSLLLLLTIIITWICQCCTKQTATGKSRRKVRRLSTVLFVLSVFCFCFLGLCLFANEHINRGITKSVNGIEDVNKEMRLAQAQASSLNGTSEQAAKHITELEELIHDKSKQPGVNQTLVRQIDVLLTNISDAFDTIGTNLNGLQSVLSNVEYLQTVHSYGDFAELERWLLLVTVLSIMICVLFAGVISFCRQSKKGAVMFSATGIVIFIVVSLVHALVLPASVALSDFCSSGGNYIRGHLTPPMINALEFYRTCEARPSHDNVPPILGVNKISDSLSNVQSNKFKLDSLLDTAFNHSAEITNASSALASDATQSLIKVGALESSLACYAYRDDVNNMRYGICDQAVVGATIMCFALLMLQLLFFVLLIVVSRSWNLFSKLPSDYMEVGDDDPFCPRVDSQIVDIYSTNHMFNPRTRDRAEPSTNTTTATAIVDEQTTPLWNRTPPQASSSMSRSPYGNNDQYGNYHERYNM